MSLFIARRRICSWNVCPLLGAGALTTASTGCQRFCNCQPIGRQALRQKCGEPANPFNPAEMSAPPVRISTCVEIATVNCGDPKMSRGPSWRTARRVVAEVEQEKSLKRGSVSGLAGSRGAKTGPVRLPFKVRLGWCLHFEQRGSRLSVGPGPVMEIPVKIVRPVREPLGASGKKHGPCISSKRAIMLFRSSAGKQI